MSLRWPIIAAVALILLVVMIVSVHVLAWLLQATP